MISCCNKAELNKHEDKDKGKKVMKEEERRRKKKKEEERRRQKKKKKKKKMMRGWSMSVSEGIKEKDEEKLNAYNITILPSRRIIIVYRNSVFIRKGA